MNYKKSLIFLAILFFGAFGLAKSLLAATINAISCSQADVQTAINISVTGDTISVPAGNCTWTTITAGVPSILLNKSITLKGTGIGATIITDGTASTNWDADPILTSANNWRITGFEFHAGDVTAFTIIYANGTGWRVDHNKFVHTGANRAIIATGQGLIDNNIFIKAAQWVSVFGTGTSWTESLSLGTSNAVYVEDNTAEGPIYPSDGVELYYGARAVIRYNTLVSTIYGAHGYDTGGDQDGTFSYEMYRNTFNKTSDGKIDGILRSGTGVIFDNVFTNNYYRNIILSNYRSCTTYDAPVGTCDGNNIKDGNTSPIGTYYGWPCKDQIGRTTNQTSQPLYGWGNILDGTNIPLVVGNRCTGPPNDSTHIKANRDYYEAGDWVSATAGVGSGTYATMQTISTCTNGVGFGVTDQGSWNKKPGGTQGLLYTCASNTWNLYYTPYTYPHPLQNESGTDTTPPAAPTGLVVQ